jgi:hypothetical protein
MPTSIGYHQTPYPYMPNGSPHQFGTAYPHVLGGQEAAYAETNAGEEAPPPTDATVQDHYSVGTEGATEVVSFQESPQVQQHQQIVEPQVIVFPLQYPIFIFFNFYFYFYFYF